MKIIFPVVYKNDNLKCIAQSFHNTEQACIYNCTNQTYEWLATRSIATKAGELAEELKRIGINAVISTQMPLMALGFFTESGLTVYKATSENIEENINLFTMNQLKPITNMLAKSATECSGSCGACKTTCNT